MPKTVKHAQRTFIDLYKEYVLATCPPSIEWLRVAEAMGCVQRRSVVTVVILLLVQRFRYPYSFCAPNRAKMWIPARAIAPDWVTQAAEGFSRLVGPRNVGCFL